MRLLLQYPIQEVSVVRLSVTRLLIACSTQTMDHDADCAYCYSIIQRIYFILDEHTNAMKQSEENSQHITKQYNPTTNEHKKCNFTSKECRLSSVITLCLALYSTTALYVRCDRSLRLYPFHYGTPILLLWQPQESNVILERLYQQRQQQQENLPALLPWNIECYPHLSNILVCQYWL